MMASSVLDDLSPQTNAGLQGRRAPNFQGLRQFDRQGRSSLRVWCLDETGPHISVMESIQHNPLNCGLGSFSGGSKPAMVSTFPSCVVCSCCIPVVFAFVVTKVGLNIKTFTWVTDHTIVMTALRSCCLYSALFCTAGALCWKLPLQANSAATSLSSGLLSPSCISTFTGNYSHERPKQFSVQDKQGCVLLGLKAASGD